jgi:transcriptional regulator with XRE-family HTH domain
MPVATTPKVEALRADFRSAAQLADLLGVSRSQVTRWLRGSGIDPLNAEKVDLLELVWSNLLRLYEREAALAWLFGVNPLLGDRRPIDLIRTGRAEELMRAIRAERSDTFA